MKKGGVYCGQMHEGAQVVDTCTIYSGNVSMSVGEMEGLEIVLLQL